MKLRPWQEVGYDWVMDKPRSALWLPMGGGKTLTLAKLVRDLLLLGEVKRVLVLAPLRVAQTTWPDEFRKWPALHHIEVQPIIGSVEERMNALRNKNAQVFTINYENIPWLLEVLKRWPFDLVIADESTKLKSYRTKQGGRRAQALASVAHTHVRRFHELTGTPSPNGLQDLWGQLWFLDGGTRLCPTFKAFSDRWLQAGVTRYSPGGPQPFAVEQVTNAVKDICLAFDMRDWFDVAEPVYNVVTVDLPAKARQQYDQMERHMVLQLAEGNVTAPVAMSLTMKCLQLAGGAVYLDKDAPTLGPDGVIEKADAKWVEMHDAKIDALKSIAEEWNGSPLLVAYQWKHDLIRLQKAFPKAKVLDRDPQTIRDWNAGKIPMLLAHPQSAGHGLNLQDGGHVIVFFGHWWSLENRQQIIERVGPMRQMQSGYDRLVYVYDILARDTVDRVVAARHKTKRDLQDLLMAYTKDG